MKLRTQKKASARLKARQAVMADSTKTKHKHHTPGSRNPHKG
jgi:hypothetical protein